MNGNLRNTFVPECETTEKYLVPRTEKKARIWKYGLSCTILYGSFI